MFLSRKEQRSDQEERLWTANHRQNIIDFRGGKKEGKSLAAILTHFGSEEGCGSVIGARGLRNRAMNVALYGRLRERKHHGFSFDWRR